MSCNDRFASTDDREKYLPLQYRCIVAVNSWPQTLKFKFFAFTITANNVKHKTNFNIVEWLLNISYLEFIENLFEWIFEKPNFITQLIWLAFRFYTKQPVATPKHFENQKLYVDVLSFTRLYIMPRTAPSFSPAISFYFIHLKLCTSTTYMMVHNAIDADTLADNQKNYRVLLLCSAQCLSSISWIIVLILLNRMKW